MDIISETVAKLQAEAQNRYGESIPGDIPADNRINRYGQKKKDFWCVGYVWDFKGKDYCMFKFGHWKFPDGTNIVKSFEKTELKNKAFLRDYTRKMEEINSALDKEREENFEACVKKWKPIFSGADKEQLHDYLIEKDIESPFVSRVDSKGIMLVPLYTPEKKFGGVQRIYLDPKTEQFEKRFAYGSWIKGSICPLKPFTNAGLVYVAEGFSTAASIQTAFPDVPVICAFNAGNLYPAIETIRSVNPSCKIIIAADRDKESGTGEKYARLCVRSFSSCVYKMPFFDNDNGKWTDFNDLHRFNGLHKVQEQLKFRPSDFIIIQPLGVNGDQYYFMSSENPQPIEIKGSNLKEHYLYNLVPDFFWWQKTYPKFDKDDENKEFPTGVNWIESANALRKKCIEKGKFKYSNQRSSGVWEDNGNYYFHNGFKLHNGRSEVDIFSDNLTKNYIMGSYCQSLEKRSSITEDERKALTEIFGTISTKTQQHGLLLLGWLMSAPIAGAMPWRPHVWLTGESSAGKSWTMEKIIGVILDGFCIRPQGDSSEAGIRQAIGNQSLPLVFDEMETDDDRTSNRVTGVVMLARQASTPTEGDIMRGTASGSVQTFSPNFAMCVSSINPNLRDKQDRNRWTVIEFSKDNSNEEQFTKVKGLVKKVITRDFGKKLVSYAFLNIRVYRENFDRFEDFLRLKNYGGAHFCRQYASLLSGLSLILDPKILSDEEIENFVNMWSLGEFFEQTGEEDPAQLLEFIRSRMIRIGTDNMTVEECINLSTMDRNCIFQRALSRYGIKAGSDCFYIKRSSNANFTGLLDKTKWHNNWQITIDRIDGVTKNENKTVWINGGSSKVYRIPFARWEIKGE